MGYCIVRGGFSGAVIGRAFAAGKPQSSGIDEAAPGFRSKAQPGLREADLPILSILGKQGLEGVLNPRQLRA
jgi:hypothetical protein